MDVAASNVNYQRFIILPNGTMYALVITDIGKANDFNTNYPRVLNPGYEPGFPDDIVDEFREIRDGYSNGVEEVAITFILEKYNIGIALLKQNSNGIFKRLNTKEAKGQYGEKTFISSFCN